MYRTRCKKEQDPTRPHETSPKRASPTALPQAVSDPTLLMVSEQANGKETTTVVTSKSSASKTISASFPSHTKKIDSRIHTRVRIPAKTTMTRNQVFYSPIQILLVIRRPKTIGKKPDLISGKGKTTTQRKRQIQTQIRRILP